jgi:D-arabinose 5-phosphate isomerase GutQ
LTRARHSSNVLRRFRIWPSRNGQPARGTDVDDIERVAELIVQSERRGGRVHVTGVGKSEYIARYRVTV